MHTPTNSLNFAENGENMAKNLEILPPAPDVQGLRDYVKKMKYAYSLNKRHLENAAKGFLRINVVGKSIQYYIKEESSYENGKYLSLKDITKAKELAQRDYEKKVVKNLEKLIKVTETFLKMWSKNDLAPVFDNLLPPRKTLVFPDTLPDDQYAAEWLAKKYCGKEFDPCRAEYFTTAGLRVRSKSEIIIAETLSKQGVPFRYEYPVEINGRTFHPDFYCLDLSNRQEIIWEHFGMMTDPDYAENAAGKLEVYIKNGWIPGKNLIVTMETAASPLNQQTAKKLAAEFFA